MYCKQLKDIISLKLIFCIHRNVLNPFMCTCIQVNGTLCTKKYTATSVQYESKFFIKYFYSYYVGAIFKAYRSFKAFLGQTENWSLKSFFEVSLKF